MDFLYNKNGLAFWTQREIEVREMLVDYIVGGIGKNLKSQNKAFQMMRVEAPMLTPLELINPNYSADDYYKLNNSDDLVLRPETTMGSFVYARHLLDRTDFKIKLPLCIWQVGKSFRREQDQPSTKVRLKEFIQLELQCLYGMTTFNDYSVELIPEVKRLLTIVGPTRVEKSDRLPDYSESTMDIICEATDMEIASISVRKDFGVKDGDKFVQMGKCLEVAIGIDRCVYNFMLSTGER